MPRRPRPTDACSEPTDLLESGTEGPRNTNENEQQAQTVENDLPLVFRGVVIGALAQHVSQGAHHDGEDHEKPVFDRKKASERVGHGAFLPERANPSVHHVHEKTHEQLQVKHDHGVEGSHVLRFGVGQIAPHATNGKHQNPDQKNQGSPAKRGVRHHQGGGSV